MRTKLSILTAMTLLLGVIALPATASNSYSKVFWEGNGSDSLVACEDDQDPYLHWVLTPGGPLTIGKATLRDSEGNKLADKADSPAAVAHFYTDGEIPLDEDGNPDLSAYEGTYAKAEFIARNGRAANGSGNALLTISDGCYVPEAPFEPEGALAVEKSAAGEFDRTVTWDLDKKVDGEEKVSFNGKPGDSFPVDWEVTATKKDTGPENYRVTGKIDVSWVGNYDITVDVSDSLPGAEIDCGNGDATATLEADTDAVECDYSVTTDGEVEENTATATPVSGEHDGEPIDEDDLAEPASDTATIEWTENLTGYDDVNLGDARFNFFEEISDTTTENFPETFTCPTDLAEYDENYLYTATFVNTAELTSPNYAPAEELIASASAKVKLTCKWPLIFKGETATTVGSPTSTAWFMYTTRDELASPVTIVAGQTIDVGTAQLVNGAIEIELSGDWVFADQVENVKVHATDTPSFPVPGAYNTKETAPAGSSSYTIGVADTEYYALHLDVGRWIPDPNP